MPVNPQVDGDPVTPNNLGIWSSFTWWQPGVDWSTYISQDSIGNLPVNRFDISKFRGEGYQVPNSANDLAATYYFSFADSGLPSAPGQVQADARVYLIGASNEQIEWFEDLFANLPHQLKELFALAGSAWKQKWPTALEAPIIIEVQDWTKAGRAGATVGATTNRPWVHATIEEDKDAVNGTGKLNKADFLGRVIHELFHFYDFAGHPFSDPFLKNVVDPAAVIGLELDPGNVSQDWAYTGTINIMTLLSQLGVVPSNEASTWIGETIAGYQKAVNQALVEQYYALKFWVGEGLVTDGSPELVAAINHLVSANIISGSGNNISGYSLTSFGRDDEHDEGLSSSEWNSLFQKRFDNRIAAALNQVDRGTGGELPAVYLNLLLEKGFITDVSNPTLTPSGATALADAKADGTINAGTTINEIVVTADGTEVTEVEPNPFSQFLKGVEAIEYTGEIGAIFGSQIGRYLAGDNIFAQVAVGSVLETVSENLFEIVAAGGFVQQFPVGDEELGYNVLKNIEDELLSNLRDAGVGAVSGYLTTELIQAIGIGGFAGEVANAVGGHAVNRLIDNLAFGDHTLSFDGVSGASVANVLGSFLGTKLAGEIINVHSIEQQLGFSIGAGVGAATFGAGGSAAASAALAAGKISGFSSFVYGNIFAPGLGALLGAVVGSAIVKLIGGTPEAESGVHVVWDEALGRYRTLAGFEDDGNGEVRNGYGNWHDDSGSRDVARNMAESAAGFFNGVVDAFQNDGGEILNPTAIENGAWGQHNKVTRDFQVRYWVDGEDSHKRNSVEDLQEYFPKEDNLAAAIGAGIGYNLSRISLIGGDLFARRAFYGSVSNFDLAGAGDYDPSTIIGDLAIAADYSYYLDNLLNINYLIATNPESAFALGWGLTFQRAAELGLDQYQKSDLFGGLQSMLPTFMYSWENFSDISLSFLDNDDDGLADDLAISGDGEDNTLTIDDFASTMGLNVGSASVYSDIWIHEGASGISMIDANTSGPSTRPLEQVGGTGTPYDYSDDTYGRSLTSDDIFVGGSGNDTLSGKYGWDWLDGGAGADDIDGGVGKDVLLGREGNDTLDGGLGNDTLSDGAGTDDVQGGSGDDKILVAQDSDVDTIDGGADTDTASYRDWDTGVSVDLSTYTAYGDVLAAIENIEGSLHDDTLTGDNLANKLFGGAGADILDGGEGNDTIIGGAGADDIRGGAGINTVSYETASGGVELQLGSGGIGGDAEGDSYSDIQNVLGSEFGDVLEGDANANILMGGGGNDVFYASGGGDTYRGGDGFDIVDYSDATEGISVNLAQTNSFVLPQLPPGPLAKTSLAKTALAAQSVTTPVLVTKLEGTEGDDIIEGGAGAEEIRGLGGNDLLKGNGHSDQIWGSTGNDTIEGGADKDELGGGAGDDVVKGGLGNDLVYGGAGDDVVKGDDGQDVLYGGAGHDRISGGDGDDLAFGGDGDDTVFAAAGNDTVKAGAGNDTVFGATGLDKIFGGAGSDVLYGGDDPDTLYGEEGDDTIYGSPDDDLIDDGTGTDVVVGGSGNDTLVIKEDASADSFDGDDDVGGVVEGVDTAWFKAWTRGVTIDMGAGNFAGNSFTNIENLKLTGYDDTATGDSGNNKIEGGGGGDVLRGGAGNDTLDGEEGHDWLVGNTGNDVLWGGEDADVFEFGLNHGDDTIADFRSNKDLILINVPNLVFADLTLTAQGADTLITVASEGTILVKDAAPSDLTEENIRFDIGSAGSNLDDFIQAADGGDTIWAGDGNDLVIGGNGDDMIGGGEGNDTVRGGAGNDIIFGAAGNDNLGGESGGDVIFGGDATDVIDGGSGNDSIWGSAGNDEILDGVGSDLLIGKGGYDTFVLAQDNERDLVSGENYNGNQSIPLGEPGRDKVSYRLWDTAVSIDLEYAHNPLGNSDQDKFFGIEDLELTISSDYALGDFNGNIIEGLDGSDTLIGRGGDDTLYGGTGDDVLYGDEGNDLLIGESGSDRHVFSGAWGDDTIEGFIQGRDIIDLTGVGLSFEDVETEIVAGDTIISFASVESTITLKDFTDQLSENDFPTVVGEDGYKDIEGIIGSDYDDTLAAAVEGSWLSGGKGSDKLLGGVGADSFVINLGDGADSFSAGKGFDSIVLGAGATFDNLRLGTDVNGAVHTTSITIGEGSEQASLTTETGGFGGEFEQIILSNGYALAVARVDYPNGEAVTTGLEVIENGSDSAADSIVQEGYTNDWLAGWGGDDTLSAGGSRDVLHGGQGDDKLSGGTGSDTYLYSIGDGNDTISDVAGVDDTIVFDEGIQLDDLSYSWVGSGANKSLKISIAVDGAPDGSIVIDTWTNNAGRGRVDWVYVDGNRYNLTQLARPHLENTTPELINQSGRYTIDLPNTRVEHLDDLPAFDADGDPLLYRVNNNENFWFEGSALMKRSSYQPGPPVVLNISVIDGSQVSENDDSHILTRDIVIYFTTPGQPVGRFFDPSRPVVLDLDGDGIELISVYESGTYFDMDGDADGDLERTGWVGPDDGMLVLDRNFDGIINNIHEISFINDVEGATSDIEGLRAFDTNGDKLLSELDDDFHRFQIWRDVNSDGVSQSHELFTLEDLGITSISLDIASTNQGIEGQIDNVVTGTVAFSRSNGVDGVAGDVVFFYDQGDGTVYKPAVPSASVVITGGAGPDTIFGGLGDDSLQGAGGGDIIVASSGSDTVHGGTGSDSLLAGLGDDVVSGDAGSDTIDGAQGSDLLSGGSDADVFRFVSGWGDDTVSDFVKGEDKIHINIAGLAFADLTITVNGLDKLVTGPNGDVITLAGHAATVIDATDFIFDQSILGTSSAESLSGGEGADVISGAEGDDTLYGGSQNDRLSGELGSDRLFGQTGRDRLEGGEGADSLDGGEGADELFGGLGDDNISGGDGDDTLHGQEGTDVLDGGAGTDTASYSTASTGVSVNLGTGSALGSDGCTDSLTSIEAIEGSTFDDTLTGDSNDNSIVAGQGNDLVSGAAGADVLHGGDGSDTLAGDDGDDTISGDQGDDVLVGGINNDSLLGGQGSDTLDGGTGDDTLRGDSGADRLSGGSGNDVLIGGVAGDTFAFGENWGSDIIVDFDVTEDKIDLSAAGLQFADLTITQNNDDVNVSDGSGNTIVIRNTYVSEIAESVFEFTDIVAPKVTIDPLETNDSTPIITGTVDDPDATIEIIIAGTVYAVPNDGSGTWSLELTQPLTDGHHQVYYRVTDPTGNVETSLDQTWSEVTGADNPMDGLDAGNQSQVSFVDIDNDGDLDAFAADGNGRITYYENDGSPTAPSFLNASSSTNPFNGIDVGSDAHMAFADLDGDGDFDALVGEYDGVINYFENTGDASNPSFIQVTGAGNPFNGVDVGRNSKVEFADLDGDGDLDVFVGELYANVQYFENTGTATAPVFTSVVGAGNPFDGIVFDENFVDIEFFDVDGDGDLDAFSGNQYSSIAFLRNEGSATSPDFALPVSNGHVLDGVVVDLNGRPTFVDLNTDGTYEAFIGQHDGKFRYFVNPAGANLTVDTTAPTVAFDALTTLQASYPFLTGTVDDMDAAVSVLVDGQSYDAVNHGDGIWSLDLNGVLDSAARTISVSATDTLGNAATTDLAFDAAPNVTVDALHSANALPTITGTIDDPSASLDITIEGTTYAATNNGDGTWSVSLTTALTEGAHTVSYTATDAGGNVRTGGPLVTNFSEVSGVANPFLGVDVGHNALPTFVDIDSDGDLDAFVGAHSGQFSFFENTGSSLAPMFVERSGADNPFDGVDVGTNGQISLVDLDADGLLEAIVGNSNGVVRYFENTGDLNSPEFVEVVGTLNPFDGIDVGNTSILAMVDIDRDGDLDAFINNSVGAVAYYENTGAVDAPVFEVRTGLENPLDGVTLTALANMAFVDLDADSDLDMLSGQQDGTTRHFENTGTVGAASFTEVSGVANPLDGVDIGKYAYVSLADIDSDGDLDAFLGTEKGELHYFRNDSATNIVYSNTAPVISFNDASVLQAGYPIISGLVDHPEATISVTVAGETFAGINHGDGTWTADLTGSVVQGTHHFAVSATDQAGNVGNASASADIAAITTVDYQITNDTTPLITGTVDDPGAIVEISIGNETITATNNGDGTWSAQVLNPLGNGSFSVLHRMTDSTGFTTAWNSPAITAYTEISGEASPINGINENTSRGNMVFADIDGDGDLDMFSSGSQPEILFFENTGTGTDPVYVERTGVSNPFNAFSHTNHSTPTFADFDGDGDLDVVMGRVSGTVSYFENTGSATSFNLVQRTGVDNPFNLLSGGSLRIDVADLDGDGDLDAFVGGGDGRIRYLENTGTSTAASYVERYGSTNPFDGIDYGHSSKIKFLDMDGDGDLDALIGAEDGRIFYFKNQGTPTSPDMRAWAIENPFFGLDVGSYAMISLGDPDGDGDLDAFLGNGNTGNAFRYFEASGAGGDIIINSDAPVVAFAAESDLRSDYPIVEGTITDPSATISLTVAGQTVDAVNNGDGSWSADVSGLVVAGTHHFEVVVTDDFGNVTQETLSIDLAPHVTVDPLITSDGAPRITGTIDDPTASIEVTVNGVTYTGANNGNGTWSANVGQFLPERGYDVLFTSVDERGNETQGRNSVDSFQQITGEDNPFDGIDLAYQTSISFADLDGDGDMDALAGEYGGRVYFLRNDGEAGFTKLADEDNPLHGVDVGDESAVALVDIDNDGDMDLFVGNDRGTFKYFENTGGATNPVFSERTGLDNPLSDLDLTGESDVSFIDIDADGDLDAVTTEYSGYFRLFENTGNVDAPVFTEVLGADNPFDGFEPFNILPRATFVDADGDGDIDFFAHGPSTTIDYYENRGTRENAVFEQVTGAGNPFDGLTTSSSNDIAFADIDQDGDLDAAMGVWLGTIEFLQTQSTPFLTISNTQSPGLNLSGTQDADTLQGDVSRDTLVGGAGADLLNGGDGQDILVGDEGDDTLSGGADGDTLVGGDGDDRLIAGGGLDQILAGAGADTLDGGADYDTAIYSAAGSGLVIDMVNPNNSTGIAAGDVIRNIELIELTQFADRLVGDDANTRVRGYAGDDSLYGGAGNDTLHGMIGSDLLHGDAGDDKLHGGDSADTLFGGSDNDTLYGDAGNDVLQGDAGDDALSGGEGNDTLTSGSGTDAYVFESQWGTDRVTDFVKGEDKLDFSATDFQYYDLIISQDGSHTLVSDSYGNRVTLENVDAATIDETDFVFDVSPYSASPFQVQLDASLVPASMTLSEDGLTYTNPTSTSQGPGFPVLGSAADGKWYWEQKINAISDASFVRVGLIAPATSDWLAQSRILRYQDDVFVYRGNGKIYVGDGTGDTTVLTGLPTLSAGDVIGIALDMDAGAMWLSVNGVWVNGATDAEIAAGNTSNAVTIGITDPQSPFALAFTGSGSRSVSATYNFGSSAYTYSAPTGFQDFNLADPEGAHLLTGTSGQDTLIGTDQRDIIVAGADDDRLSGGKADDVLDGRAGNDTLEGGLGDDELTGGSGNDMLDGGDGSDHLTAGDGDDTLSGGLGDDQLTSGAGSDTYTFNAGWGADRITDFTVGADLINLMGTGLQFGDLTITQVNAHTEISEAGGNSIVLENTDATTIDASIFAFAIDGSVNSDSIVGTAAAELVTGYEGDDTIIAAAGSDTLHGNEGQDYLSAGDGDDWLSGGANNDQLYGMDGNDTLSGGDGDDYLDGSDGQDLLEGGEGRDTLVGSAGDDTLFGDNETDQLEGGSGNDLLRGGDSYDYLIGGAGADTLDGGDGHDHAYYSSSASAVSINLTTGVNTGGDAEGDVLLSIGVIHGSEFGDSFVGDGAWTSVFAGNGDDTLLGEGGTDNLFGEGGNDVLQGGIGNDTLTGGAGSDVFMFNAGWGTDTIKDFTKGEDIIDLLETRIPFGDLTITQVGAHTEITEPGGNKIVLENVTATTIDASDFIIVNAVTGTANDDTLEGTTGPDIIEGFDGDDSLAGFDGNDTLHGGAGNDMLTSGAGADLLEGGNGDDNLQGYNGNDRLFGGDGNDVLNPYAGDDTVEGGAGNDTLYGHGAGINVLDGGSGTDLLIYSHAASGIEINLADGTTGGAALGDTISNIERLTGSDFSDVITGTPSNETLSGGEGNDVVNGDAGDDALYGGAGDDTVSGGDGNDKIRGGSGADTLDGGAGVDVVYFDDAATSVYLDLATPTANTGDAAGDTYINIETFAGSDHADTLKGDAGDDNLFGRLANDLIYGRAGNDYLHGEEGNDTIHGGDGNDTMGGGAGIDNFVFGKDWGSDTVIDFVGGEDTLDLSGTSIQFADLTISQVGAHTEITEAGGNKIILENVTATTITAGDFVFANEVVGTNNADTLNGTAGSDYIDGMAGEDKLYGHGGNDTIVGGDDRDTMRGGAGDDLLQGGAGDEYLIGDDGADTLDGGAGSDWADYSAETTAVNVNLATGVNTGGAAEGDVLLNIERIHGGAGADTLTGSASSYFIRGAAGNDLITGGSANEYLEGGVGADTIEGGSGNDHLYGEADNDSLSGGAGDDWLIGGVGADTLDGGAGVDWTRYDTAAAAISINLETGVHTGIDGDVLRSVEGVYGSNFDDTMVGSSGDEGLQGREGNDLLVGGAGNDTLWGNGHSDTLDGGAGNDTLWGGASNDVFTFGVGWGVDTVGDFTKGTDTLDLTATELQFADLTITQVGAHTEITEAGGNKIILENVTASTIDASDFMFVNLVTGTANDDTLAGTAAADVIEGFAGNDVINAGAGNDTVRAGAGNDLVEGGAGADRLEGNTGFNTLEGGAGADTLVGSSEGGDKASYDSSSEAVTINLATGSYSGGDAAGDVIVGITEFIGSAFGDHMTAGLSSSTFDAGAGEDTLLGGAANDRLYGRDGADVISGGAGDDYIDAGDGTDTLTGGEGNDTFFTRGGGDIVHGGNGDDIVHASNSNDRIFGEAGNDTINASSGSDTVHGGSDNDVINAGTNNDRINGGTGDDTLSGGGQNDTFVFDGGWGTDTITDFTRGEDTLDLTATSLQFADLTITQVGVHTEITEAGGNRIILENVTATTLDASDFMFVDVVAPIAAVTTLTTSDTTPTISGTVDDPSASIEVTIDGQTYSGVNNGDGTWSADVVNALTADSYVAEVKATDPSGNSATYAPTGYQVDEYTGASNPFDGLTLGDRTNAAFADLDADGDLDAFVGNAAGDIKYFENGGSASNPSFSAVTGSGNPFDGVDVGAESTIEFADLDNDGDLDAIIGEGVGTINYFENTGTSSSPVFSEITGAGNPFDGVDVGAYSYATFTDLDGDGDLDAVLGADNVSGGSSTAVWYYENTGSVSNPAFTERTGTDNPLNGLITFSSFVKFMDIDADGDQDAFSGNAAGTIKYFENTGTTTNPTFAPVTGSNNPFDGIDVGHNSSLAFADLDGDGKMGAFVGEAGDGGPFSPAPNWINYFEIGPTPNVVITAPAAKAAIAPPPVAAAVANDGPVMAALSEEATVAMPSEAALASVSEDQLREAWVQLREENGGTEPTRAQLARMLTSLVAGAGASVEAKNGISGAGSNLTTSSLTEVQDPLPSSFHGDEKVFDALHDLDIASLEQADVQKAEDATVQVLTNAANEAQADVMSLLGTEQPAAVVGQLDVAELMDIDVATKTVGLDAANDQSLLVLTQAMATFDSGSTAAESDIRQRMEREETVSNLFVAGGGF